MKPSSLPLPAFGLRRSAFRLAFTLTEMLVSITVLVLLIVLITQLLNSATKVTTGSRNRMDADAQARLVFDRMALDIGSMLLRKDVDYVFDKQTYNDNLFFYSEAPAFFNGTAATQNAVGLIGYRINPATFQLERLGKGLSWDGKSQSVVFLTYPAPSPSPAVPDANSTIKVNWPLTDSASPEFAKDPPDDAYHVISDQVYRLEYCYLLKTGALSLTRDATKGFEDVSAIVVAIAILDNNSRKIVSNLNSMVGALLDPTDANLTASPPQLMAQTWAAAVNSGSFASTAGIPQSAASQVRIYQRYFYLNH